MNAQEKLTALIGSMTEDEAAFVLAYLAYMADAAEAADTETEMRT